MGERWETVGDDKPKTHDDYARWALSEKAETLLEHAREWMRGCSNARDDPQGCESCTEAFLDAVKGVMEDGDA